MIVLSGNSQKNIFYKSSLFEKFLKDTSLSQNFLQPSFTLEGLVNHIFDITSKNKLNELDLLDSIISNLHKKYPTETKEKIAQVNTKYNKETEVEFTKRVLLLYVTITGLISDKSLS